MTSKFIYKVIRIKAGFVLIIILYNCSKGKTKQKKCIQNRYYYLPASNFNSVFVILFTFTSHLFMY